MVADGNNKGIGGVSSRGWGQGSNGKNLWVVDYPEEHEVLCLSFAFAHTVGSGGQRLRTDKSEREWEGELKRPATEQSR